MSCLGPAACAPHSYVLYSYASMPTFGRTTIRKFRENVSAMKEFAARDFQQCLIVSLFYARPQCLLTRSTVRDAGV